MHAMMVDVDKFSARDGRDPMQLSSNRYSFLRRPLVNMVLVYMGEGAVDRGFLHF